MEGSWREGRFCTRQPAVSFGSAAFCAPISVPFPFHVQGRSAVFVCVRRCSVQAGVSAVPDVNVFGLTERERFLIIGCDGLWGVSASALATHSSHVANDEVLTVHCTVQ